MVEISDSETAVIPKEGDSAIELDSKQLVAISQIDGVIKEGRNYRSKSRPCQPTAVRRPYR